MCFDDADRMWVELTTSAGHSFDVFDHDGTNLGNKASPGRQAAVPPYVRDDRLFVVATDSLDVQSVKVYAVERQRGSLTLLCVTASMTVGRAFGAGVEGRHL